MESITDNAAQQVQMSQMISHIFNITFGCSPDGIVYQNNQLIYECANESFYKMFKIKDYEEFLGKASNNIFTEKNTKLVNEVNAAIIKDRQPISYILNLDENKILNITSFPIIKNKKMLGILSVVKDITQEEVVKEKFVAKHFQLKSLLENIPMLIYMQDKNLNYIAGTKPARDFVKDGYDALSNIKLNLNKSKTESEKENQFVLQNNKILVKEKEIIDCKGTSHWYKIYKVPINDFNGDVTGIITLANNIDPEKQLQTQRESFVASLGHDLKNPTIAQIRGLELLLKGDFGELSNEQKELVEMVLDSCKYMNGMLASLLATYRDCGGAIKLKFIEFSFSDLVMECVSEMIYVAKDKNVKISVDSSLDNENITADRVQIKRVIMNLISNGIKYAYKESIIKLAIYSKNKDIFFEFENESPYIPEEKQKTIFAQYVSYASFHHELGIGLGLYASKKIVEGHFGKMYLSSFPENRNIFGFKIPRKQNYLENTICF